MVSGRLFRYVSKYVCAFLLLFFSCHVFANGVYPGLTSIENFVTSLWQVVFKSNKPKHKLKVGEVFRDCDECPQMVVIPAGTYLMGSPKTEPDRMPGEQQHKVRIAEPFAIGKYTITFDEWQACERAGGCIHLDKRRDFGFGRGSRPMIDISWDDAQQYVQWIRKATGMAYRLPSEAEWEYAARAGTTTSRYWGEDVGLTQACKYANVYDQSADKARHYNATAFACNDGIVGTAPVGSFLPNKFGLYDMLGNVWQMTEDCWHQDYSGAPADGSVWAGGDCSGHAVRGGSWNFDPPWVRSAVRFNIGREHVHKNLGFRLVRNID